MGGSDGYAPSRAGSQPAVLLLHHDAQKLLVTLTHTGIISLGGIDIIVALELIEQEGTLVLFYFGEGGLG